MRIDRAAAPFALALAAVAVAAGWLVHPALAVLPLLLLLFTLWFFRDPERTPFDDSAALISPVDGRIIVAGPRRVSIFMNVFDVHVCRSPAAGTIERVEHHTGRFLAAWRDDASEQNERAHVELRRDDGSLRFTLVAGLVARRIVVRAGVGDRVVAGGRVGLIRFGSRVDVDLPAETRPTVRIGDRVRGGETVIARRETPA